MKEKVLGFLAKYRIYVVTGIAVGATVIVIVILCMEKNKGNQENQSQEQSVKNDSSEYVNIENTSPNPNESSQSSDEEDQSEAYSTDKAASEAEDNQENAEKNTSWQISHEISQDEYRPGDESNTTKTETTAGQVAEEDDSQKAYIFNHPGVLYTEEAIAYMKYAVDNKVSPNYETWQALITSPFSNTMWTPRAVETIIRGGNGDNVSKLYVDVARAYQCALIWRISGSEAHGQAACRILNSWSAVLKTVTGNADRYLASGLFGYQFANMAELMRDHPGFKVEQMENMLLNVFYYPLNERFLTGNSYGDDHNDAYIGNYWANWDLCNMASAISIGIFCERQDIYNKAVEYFKSGMGNGSIYNAIPYVYQDGTAQWQESGRDQGHTNLGLGLMACVCEMAWSQGDDLYEWSGNRLLKAAEYIAKYNNGYDVNFSEYEWGSGRNGDIQHHYVISASGRGEIRPIWNMIYNHYVNRKGLSAPNIAERLGIISYEYGAVPGGHATTYDQPGWGSLTYANNPGKAKSGISAGNIPEGSYRIVSVHTGKALAAADNGVLCQREKSASMAQQWKVTYAGGGEYKVENAGTGRAMTVENCSYANGGIITTSEYTGAVNQKFAFLVADTGNYRIIASNSGKAIDIKDWSGDDSAVIFQWRYVMGNNQKWYLEKLN